MNFFDRMLRFQVDEMNSHLQLIFHHFFSKSENICKKTVFEPRKFFFYYLPRTEVQPPKFENLKSYLQLSADQLMPWSMANSFGNLSGRFEILQAKIG